MDLLLLEHQIRNSLIIGQLHQQRLNKGQNLSDHVLVGEVDAALSDGLGDVLGHFSFSLELEVLDEIGVFIHGQDDVRHCLKRVGQEFTDVELAVIIN